MTRESMAERQVRTEEQLKAVVASLATLTQQGHEAAESRRRVYEGQEATRLEIMGIKHRLDGLEKSVEAIKPTSDEYLAMRQRVIGAGTMGSWLWKAGIVIMSCAGWLVGAYAWLTGRPPP